MIPAEFAPVAGHIWQSTLFAVVAVLLTLALRRNHARVRYAILLIASYKFLIPFSWLVSLGREFEWRSVPAALPHAISTVTDVISIPSFLVPTVAAKPAPDHLAVLPLLIWLIWGCGSLIVIAGWTRQWFRLRAMLRLATPLPIPLHIPVVSVPSQLEPGVFGIFRPVLLLPEGIAEKLSRPQLRVVLAHELCHVRRRDNLAAAVHMLVEALFWFHPLVWWLDRQIVEERERACDDEVVRMGSEPAVYVETILTICKSYVESPVACVSGISGSDLKRRVTAVMANRLIENLSLARKLLLSTLAIAAIIAPIAFGIINAPLLYAQSSDSASAWEKAAGGKMKFEVASVKQDTAPIHMHTNIPLNAQDMFTPTGGLMSSTDYPLSVYIVFAYKVPFERLSSIQSQLPKWANTNRYDIDARTSGNPTKDQFRLMMQALLADRFKLVVHHETKQVPALALVLEKPGKLGPQLRPHPANSPCATGQRVTALVDGGFPNICGRFASVPPNDPGCVRVGARNVSMAYIIRWFSLGLLWDHERPLIDKTGLAGTYDIVLEVTPPADVHIPDNFQRDESGPTFLEALKDQLGLTLQSTTAPADHLIIDHIEEPAPN